MFPRLYRQLYVYHSAYVVMSLSNLICEKRNMWKSGVSELKYRGCDAGKVFCCVFSFLLDGNLSNQIKGRLFEQKTNKKKRFKRKFMSTRIMRLSLLILPSFRPPVF